jgi:TonB family protein
MPRFPLVVAVLALLAAPNSMRAQRGRSQAPPTARRDCTPPSSGDSITLWAYLSVAPLDQRVYVDRPTLDQMAIEIGKRVTLGAPLDLGVYAFDQGDASPLDSTSRAHLSFSGLYTINVPRTGLPKGVSVPRTTLSRTIDAAVIAAITAAAKDTALQPIPLYVEKDTLALAVFVGVTPDTLNDSIIPLFRFKSPRVRVEHLAQPARGGAGPRYPQEHVGSGFEGKVVLDFVVNAAGQTEPRTVRVQRTPDVLFLQSALNYLPTMRYTPATAGGCPIALRVAQPFDFRSVESP